jgi:hypothetical protein
MGSGLFEFFYFKKKIRIKELLDNPRKVFCFKGSLINHRFKQTLNPKTKPLKQKPLWGLGFRV